MRGRVESIAFVAVRPSWDYDKLDDPQYSGRSDGPAEREVPVTEYQGDLQRLNAVERVPPLTRQGGRGNRLLFY